MPAPDYQTLYEFEDRIEAALVSQLSDYGVTATAQRDDTTVSTPRVAVQFAVGAESGHYALDVNGYHRPDRWQGQIAVEITTDRDVDKTGTDSHLSIRAKCRAALYAAVTEIDSDVLPYHEIFSLEMQATTPTTNNDSNQDVSTILCSVLFGIREGAWPTA